MSFLELFSKTIISYNKVKISLEYKKAELHFKRKIIFSTKHYHYLSSIHIFKKKKNDSIFFSFLIWEVEKIKIHNIIEKTFIFLFVIMPSEQISLQEKKTIVQRIINNHLPEKERFSIDGLSNDRLEFLVEFLLEEDEIERDKIWARLEEEIEETKNNLKISTLEVQKIKDLLDHEKLEKWKLQNLLNLVHSEKELEQEIKDLDF